MEGYIERIAKLEEKLDSAFKVLNKMDNKLDAWNANYVPRQELNEMFRARDKEIEELKEDIDNGLIGIRQEFETYKQQQDTNKNSNKSVYPAWAAAAIALVALIVTLWPK